jgi:branched-chain amino acid transport system ATP-binding protein
LLLLDEPLQGLAPLVVRSVIAVIRAGARPAVVEQNLRMATEIADRAYVLDDGRVTYHCRASELARDEQHMRALAGAGV